MKKELPQTFDSASAHPRWKATAYYTGGYATSDKDLAKALRETFSLRKIKDKLIKKIKTIKIRKK